VNERELHRVLVRVVPDLPSPQDRVGAVIERARRQQRVMVTAAVAVITGVVAMGGVPLFRYLAGPVPIPPGYGDSPAASPTPRDDGVLETPGCVGYQPDLSTMDDGIPVAPNQEALGELSQRIQPEARGEFADVFASAEIRSNGRLRLNRKPSAEFDAWIMRDFGDECVEIADARATQAEMDARALRLGDDYPYWEGRGIEIVAVGGDPVDGVVVVEVAAADLERARKEIPDRYPDLSIRVATGEPIVPGGG
jgi:hypothetical protein